MEVGSPRLVRQEDLPLWPGDVWSALPKRPSSESPGGHWGHPGWTEWSLRAHETSRERCRGDHSAGHMAAS